MSASLPSVRQIPSVQRVSHDLPRFRVPVALSDEEADAVEAAESTGGVDADVRAFLDAQLEEGDLFVDLDPGLGFVALGAATAPGGIVTVLVSESDEAVRARLQDAAVEVGGWLEWCAPTDHASLRAAVEAHRAGGGRVLVQASAAQLPVVAEALAALVRDEALVAMCVRDAAWCDDWDALVAFLRVLGLTPAVMTMRGDEALLVPVEARPDGAVIAIPAGVVHAMEGEVLDPPAGGATAPATLGAGTVPAETGSAPTGTTAATASVIGGSVAAPPQAASPRVFPAAASERPTWVAARDGLLLQTSHSRTGYGVAGSHLLAALQRREVPVTLFPLGAVDPSLTENPRLGEAIARQDRYRGDLPSVRIAQAFDLAQHVGRGPRVAFPIFELDTFTARELHHLRQQDGVLVCTEWARQVCRQNGLTDVPIDVVPLGVDRTVFHEQVTPARRWPDTVFLQVGKLEARKGQLELLRAFEAAFTPKDPVRLVLACGNPFIPRETLDAQLRPFRQSPMAARITLITSELATLRDVAALMAGADCGVFPVRAEGWNLEALEMLSMGKAVIATHCTAHTAYLSPANARLIQVDQLEVAHGGRAPGRWAAWGPSQHEQLVTQLRAVHTARREGALPVNQAGIATAERHQWEDAADALLRGIQTVIGG
jgi:glycosyltransferase involved in cell wall biosynthesis